MKIVKIDTQIVKIPLKRPFKTALREVSYLEDFIVKLYTDNNLVGYGSGVATAILTGDTIKSMQEALYSYYSKILLDIEIEDFNELLDRVQTTMVHNTTIKSAIETALYDIYSQSINLPLYRALGGSKKELKTDITISLNSVDEMLIDSQKAIDLGYTILKIKVGESISKDYDRIYNIARTFPQIDIRIDANQAWSVKDTIRLLQKLENQDIIAQLIEQPIEANNYRGLKYIKDRTLTPLLVDESIFSPQDAINLLELDACDMINIKLAKTGGIKNALLIADIAKLYNVECMMGCMLEGSIAISSAVHVALARSNITMIDLDSVNLLKYNPIVTNIEFDESRILPLENNYGLGVEL